MPDRIRIDNSLILHTRHEFLPTEWALSIIKRQLVTQKYKCHCCTPGDIFRCWSLLQLVDFRARGSYWWLFSIGAHMAHLDTTRASPQGRDFQVRSSSVPPNPVTSAVGSYLQVLGGSLEQLRSPVLSGESWTPLSNNTRGGFPHLALGPLLVLASCGEHYRLRKHHGAAGREIVPVREQDICCEIVVVYNIVT